MKIIFLDFDGVLNSAGSFLYEDRRRNQWKLQGVKGPINETLCNVCTSNFQLVLDRYPDVKIVISSTWRELYSLDWLKSKLSEYRIDSSRVIDITPSSIDGNRGREIQQWLSIHTEVTHYVIIDDNDWFVKDLHGAERFVQTTWGGGMTNDHAYELIDKLSNKNKKKNQDSEPEIKTDS